MSMENHASGMLETPPASEGAGGLGPGEPPQARPVLDAGDEPWRAPAAGPRTRTPEHATGHVLDAVA